MQTKEILVQESANRRRIVLIKEGIFWRAYQRSAYLFWHNIRELKVTHKYVKAVKSDVFYVGFPAKVLEQVLGKAKVKGWKIEREEREVQVITDQEVTKEQFEEWARPFAVPKAPMEPKEMEKSGQAQIIEQIRCFPIMEKTPLETQQFVLELKRMINGLV